MMTLYATLARLASHFSYFVNVTVLRPFTTDAHPHAHSINGEYSRSVKSKQTPGDKSFEVPPHHP